MVFMCLGIVPLLHSIRVRNWHWKWPYDLETGLLRYTRPFTSKWLLAVLVAAYIIALSFLTRAQYYLIPSDAWIGCTSTYWLANDGCGLDGDSCAPFDNSSLDFRCPAQCTSVVLANPRTIGNISVDNVPLIVGGGDTNKTYRGDSFICSAAVQAYVNHNSR